MIGSTLSSCKSEDPVDPDQPAEKKTYLVSHNADNEVTDYHYEGSSIVMATGTFGDTTWFIYTNNQLTKIEDNQGKEAFLTYGSSSIPTKIETKLNGSFDTDYQITTSGSNITKVQSFPHGQTSNPTQIINFIYDGNTLERLELSLNDGSNNYIPVITADTITTDGKQNPYGMDFAITYMNFDNPFAFSTSNVTDASVLAFGSPTEFSAVYSYDADGFVTVADIDIPGLASYTEFTYSSWQI